MENFKPGVMEKLGLDYDSLAERNPGVVMLSISNFGQTGPYRDFLANELIEYGMGGQLQSTGTPDRPPVKLGGSIGLYQTGQMAAFAACTALFRKEFTGAGDYVDISIFETQAASQDRRSIFMLNHQYTGALVKRRADAEDLAFGIFPCADGAICFWSGVTRFPRAAELVGRADLLDDPLYAQYEHGGSAESIHHFNNEILLPWLLDRSMDDAWRDSQAVGLATAPIFSPGRFFEHPTIESAGSGKRSAIPPPETSNTPALPSGWRQPPPSTVDRRPSSGSTTPRSSAASLAARKPSSARSPLWGSSKPCARRRTDRRPSGAFACSISRWSWPAPTPRCCSPIGAPK